ncbi:DUF2848 domain-containing protein [Alphaproteobacteria bacterium GH1-50]|uniref:DUF2848 domain-containing protein n=1 Tax=Kangsaoukella pontilimi TaxID=2691042 RepID=A0A7C9MVC8_9RHOB|nr:DUF2848 domain-containing protein [Kangsaoukella pontilimi]MXQ07580.1 DUF2848 domain-containing protein [Kangsaoukella pontilimi]
MRFETPEGSREFAINRLIVAGWTGRDEAAVRHHIEELAEIGVAPPSTVPLFYRVSTGLLTRDRRVQVLGGATSGEVEPFLIKQSGRLWLGLASDHTDRELEAVSVAASKQACAKPVADTLWAWDEVADRADELRLTCEIDEKGSSTLYQKGTLAAIRPLADLIEGAGMVDGDAMLCGTLTAIGGVRPAAAYRMALEDPERGQRIELRYKVDLLPVVA